jgi:hypothetical protein
MQDEVSLPAAAASIGVSWAVAWRLAMTGELGPVRQVGTRWRVSAAGLDAYCERAQLPARLSLLPAQHAE